MFNANGIDRVDICEREEPGLDAPFISPVNPAFCRRPSGASFSDNYPWGHTSFVWLASCCKVSVEPLQLSPDCSTRYFSMFQISPVRRWKNMSVAVVPSGSGTRRRFTEPFKQWLVKQTLRTDVSIASVALRDGQWTQYQFA